MTTNDATRAALVEERTNVVRSIIASAMKWAANNPHKDPNSAAFRDVLSQTAADAYRAATYFDKCTCDFCNDRAAPEPDAAAGDDLDAMLDSVHPGCYISYVLEEGNHWRCCIRWPASVGKRSNPYPHRDAMGTGATRMEAIQDAASSAKGGRDSE